MPKKRTGLLSESELAAWLRVSQRSVRRFVDAGDLTRVRVGHTPAYVWDDVLRFAGVRTRDAARAQASPLLTTDEVAAICRGFSPGSIKRLAKSGEIPSIRIGRSLRFLAAEIEDWIDAKRSIPTADVRKNRDLAGIERNAP